MLWFKKKKEKEAPEKIQEQVLTEERKEELLQFISTKTTEATTLVEVEKAKAFEEIGLAYDELEEENEAILAFEKSLEVKKSIGASYKTLLKLYNKKRTEALKANDQDTLQVYLKKMDELMQISKDVTRGAR
ncbi:hypothetical protein [Bacillus sp. B1-b2]|uniref:hypothetical protein n=1 Tax=Bacillus sp. B1-b2 TaxID=2653201 RepID=UPI0012627798|nr:hypothetical protein [Bacillus sp. B1-b2]KAB7668384.1 hypothetical protein F9279_13275 [Bacillus sp. B1-b2]